MKRQFRVLGVALTGSLLLLCVAGCGGDRESEDSRTVILPAGEIHDGWYFAAGQRVIINGTVNGDAYVAAGQVEVNGTINGDLLTAGGDLDIGGTVTDDVRAAGGSIRLNGSVGKNATAAGGNIIVRRTAVIHGGLLVVGGNLAQGGSVENNLRAAVGNIEVTGSVGKNTDVTGGRLVIARGANIGGNLTALLSEKDRSEIAEGAVKGSINVKQQEETPHRILGIASGKFWFKAFWTVSLFLTGFVLFLLSRKLFADYGTVAITRLGMSLLWGLAVVVCTPIAVIIVCITVIGIPLGLMVLALYLIMIYLSHLCLGLAVGMRLFGSDVSSGWILYFVFIVGTIIFQGLSLIPILGTLLEIGAILLGCGAMVLLIKGLVKK
jgi:cytoskeletal protein CcmA (bactofilin family)